MVNGDFNIAAPAIFYFNFSSPSGVAKHDLHCVQFAESASKLTCATLIFLQAKNFSHCITHILYRKLLLVSTVVQIELSLLEINFLTLLKGVCLLF
jgi:hypothetical protein